MEMPKIAKADYSNTVSNYYSGFSTSAVKSAHLPEFVFIGQDSNAGLADVPTKKEGKKMPAKDQRRLVRVVIVDTDVKVPVNDAVLHTSDEMFTDKTDQELFFEINLPELLSKHNEKRTKVIDKDVKDRVQYLEPARIRDLSMVVIDIAKF